MEESEHEMVDHDDLVEVYSTGRRAVSSGVPSIDGSMDSGDERALSDTDIAHAATMTTIASTVRGPSSDALEVNCMAEAKERMKKEINDDEWEDVLDSNILLKKVLREGTANGRKENEESPKDGQYVTVNIEDKSFGVDNYSNHRFILGCSMQIDAIDIVLKLMSIGEKIAIKTKARLAYGEIGLRDVIPPEQEMEYEIELISIEDGPDPETMKAEEMLDLAKTLKTRGNFYFERGNYEKAIFVYKRIFSLLAVNKDNARNFKKSIFSQLSSCKELSSMFSTCKSNIAICYAKLEEWKDVLEMTEDALQLDGTNTKAVYWRAIAMKATGDLFEAKSLINKALESNPEDVKMKKLLNELNVLTKERFKNEREIYKKMMSGMGSGKKDTWKKKIVRSITSRTAMVITLSIFVVFLSLFVASYMKLNELN